jgi:hypothetical protein
MEGPGPRAVADEAIEDDGRFWQQGEVATLSSSVGFRREQGVDGQRRW